MKSDSKEFYRYVCAMAEKNGGGDKERRKEDKRGKRMES